MSCDCGERFQRIFDATNLFTVYFDAERKTMPLHWKQEGMSVYIKETLIKLSAFHRSLS